MKIRDLITEKLSQYILREVDQLSNGVADFFEFTHGGSDEYDGDWSEAEVIITYRVPVEVNRMGTVIWHYRDTLECLITELDKMEKN